MTFAATTFLAAAPVPVLMARMVRKPTGESRESASETVTILTKPIQK
jgi:hypothetical protein